MEELSIKPNEPQKASSHKDLLQQLSHLAKSVYLIEEGIEKSKESDTSGRYVVLRIYLEEADET